MNSVRRKDSPCPRAKYKQDELTSIKLIDLA